MVIENDPSARMQLRSRGELVAPGTCMVCGSGTRDEGYVDLNVFIEYVGTAYLCFLCVQQAAEIIGMFTPAEVQSQQDLIAELSEKNVAYEEELANVRPVMDSVRKSFVAAGVLTDPALIVGDAIEQAESITAYEVPEVIEPDATEIDEGSEAGEPVATEPDSKPVGSRANRKKPRNITF